MSQATSSRVASRQSVSTARAALTRTPIPSDPNSRGRPRTMRTSAGVFIGQHLSRVVADPRHCHTGRSRLSLPPLGDGHEAADAVAGGLLDPDALDRPTYLERPATP